MWVTETVNEGSSCVESLMQNSHLVRHQRTEPQDTIPRRLGFIGSEYFLILSNKAQ